MAFLQFILQGGHTPVEKAGAMKLTLLELTIRGGWVMIPIILLSFVAAYVFIERYYTSTLVHPTALKLLLPKGAGQTSARPQTTVSITSDLNYFFEKQPVTIVELEAVLKQKLASNPETYIALHADKSVQFENVVKVLNIAQSNNYKLINATSPK